MSLGQASCMSHLQGRQRHKRSGTAHYCSALWKAVFGGAVCVDRGAKCWSVCAKRGKIFSHVFLAMRKRSRSIKMVVLGKKRPWLLWSFNGRPTTRTRNGCHCRVCKRRLCVTTLHVILKSGRLEKWSGQSRTSRTGGAALDLWSGTPSDRMQSVTSINHYWYIYHCQLISFQSQLEFLCGRLCV